MISTYWWLYKYLKMTTTDFFKLRRPTAAAGRHHTALPGATQRTRYGRGRRER